jgi:hypothetical protein
VTAVCLAEPAILTTNDPAGCLLLLKSPDEKIKAIDLMEQYICTQIMHEITLTTANFAPLKFPKNRLSQISPSVCGRRVEVFLVRTQASQRDMLADSISSRPSHPDMGHSCHKTFELPSLIIEVQIVMTMGALAFDESQ